MNCIILARGGSKGVSGKNLRLLNGEPLLSYPIKAAKATNFIENVFVSTDSEEIAAVAKKYGAEVIKRPDYLSSDNSLDADAFRHYVSEYADYGDIVHLRTTTPILDPEILNKAHSYFTSRKECTSMRSAHKLSESVYKFFQKNGDYWKGFFPDEEGEYYNLPRQKLPASYHPNGYIDIVRPKFFMNSNSFHGERMLSFETPFVHEIDTEEDFNRLERELKNV